MKWTFAKNDGGRDSGFHDAGVETFKGNFDRYLARELIQNSLDARLDPNKPVMVRFELLKLDRSAIPDMDALKATLARCAEYWGAHDKKADEYFRKAEGLAKGKSITTLKIGDFNTTGVHGSDSDRSKNWYHLIRCAGSSSKGGGEGGSFGIGKNAPFAASQMRTVLYSTFNIDDEHVFQGVATLVSHNHPEGGVSQPTGYLGGLGGASIRETRAIPSKFLRKEHGTDIYVLGFPGGESWQEDLVYSVLDNFWPAIHFDDLEVIVGEVLINKSTLPSLLESFSGKEDFTAHLYYQAFTKPSHPFHAKLRRLNDVSLYMLTSETEMPKRIAMVRKTGMKIFEKQFRSVIPFSGVFMCRNEQGNIILREMEHPRHDIWDPDHPEKGAHKKTESEYVNFIRECIRKLVPVDDSKVINIPGLNRFLPDDDESPEEAFDGTSDEENTTESANRKHLPEKIEGQKIDPKRRPMQPDETKPIEGDEETEDGSDNGDGTGGGPGKMQKPVEGGNGSSGGGDGDGRSGESSGTHGGYNSRPSIPIRYRTYSRNPSAGVYILTVAPEKGPAKDAMLLVSTVGDDQKAPAEIRAARTTAGQDVEVRAGGVLGPIRLSKDSVLQLEVILNEPIRVAMEVSAHEA